MNYQRLINVIFIRCLTAYILILLLGCKHTNDFTGNKKLLPVDRITVSNTLQDIKDNTYNQTIVDKKAISKQKKSKSNTHKDIKKNTYNLDLANKKNVKKKDSSKDVNMQDSRQKEIKNKYFYNAKNETKDLYFKKVIKEERLNPKVSSTVKNFSLIPHRKLSLIPQRNEIIINDKVSVRITKIDIKNSYVISKPFKNINLNVLYICIDYVKEWNFIDFDGAPNLLPQLFIKYKVTCINNDYTSTIIPEQEFTNVDIKGYRPGLKFTGSIMYPMNCLKPYGFDISFSQEKGKSEIQNIFMPSKDGLFELEIILQCQGKEAIFKEIFKLANGKLVK